MSLSSSDQQRPISSRLDALMVDLNSYSQVWGQLAQGQQSLMQTLEAITERLSQIELPSPTDSNPEFSNLHQEVAGLRSLLQEPASPVASLPPDLLQNLQSLSQDCRTLTEQLQEPVTPQVASDLGALLQSHSQALHGLAQGQHNLRDSLVILLDQITELRDSPEINQRLSQLEERIAGLATGLGALPKATQAEPKGALTDLKYGLEERLNSIEQQLKTVLKWQVVPRKEDRRNLAGASLLLILAIGAMWLWMHLTISPLLTKINSRLNSVEIRLNKLGDQLGR
ncbi:hypothetical protein [Leptolyngbya sp. FACHB-261]|uniref:hypothetical protein n=1 Tax=Leptolyngbya sp. FACHB-261 TaxID=2692806 RepID=UPI001684A18D|nr:hypothetical protein [Leptolyngbya sp. FACHB-261]MBD2100495.1 hypothetical protein [Leptolyngbya sp. FACHB-261]